MITITSDSLNIALVLLKEANFTRDQIFYNDGVHSHQVLGLNIKYEDFEIGGMYLRQETRYTLVLHAADCIEFWFDREQVRFESRKIVLPHSNVGLPSELAQHNF
ncbi:hypothetical protein [Vibrio vulnificus]|uniref:hypothetical protein n=1 Tax=Vibrio vulnificus TaxID=672 RepID=UPI000D3E0643|nr:hypothetical protein [Vibrio vulnificus]MBN8109753.1 hypothetical protein [Vibrio vulnificus]PUZ86987.1 hypothetical protein DC360_11940 [Vibrio vulnificus]HAS6031365.1 hypothetical protein [Vibrio vulnificus]HAS6050142.1 hypothetical protein [Vibrio vulnificus]HAS6116488.1 hypothetical protein [Vibrio vulnificus]